jgi:hypothetical protein
MKRAVAWGLVSLYLVVCAAAHFDGGSPLIVAFYVYGSASGWALMREALAARDAKRDGLR